jgi:hypothetical protein
LRRCAETSALIAAGRYDVLAGRYIDFAEDLDALARQVAREPAPTHH